MKRLAIGPFVPALTWALTIAVLSTVAAVRLPALPVDVLGPDKLAHVGAYTVLAVLLYWAFHRIKARRAVAARFIWLGATAYGLAMETLQFACFPGRTFEMWDILANFCGVAVGWFASLYFIR